MTQPVGIRPSSLNMVHESVPVCRDRGFHKYIQNVTSSLPCYHRSDTHRTVSELVLFCTHMGHQEQHEALEGKGMGVAVRQTRPEEDMKQLQGLGTAGMPLKSSTCAHRDLWPEVPWGRLAGWGRMSLQSCPSCTLLTEQVLLLHLPCFRLTNYSRIEH